MDVLRMTARTVALSAFLLTFGVTAASAAAATAPDAQRPAPADVLTSFLLAYQQAARSDAVQYLDPSLQSQLRAGRSMAEVVGFAAGYRSFCVASYGPAGVGMSSIDFLATLNYPTGPLQRNVMLHVNPENGVWRIAGVAIPNGQTGLAASQSLPGTCTPLPAGSGQVPSTMPNTGEGGIVLRFALLPAFVGLLLVFARAAVAMAQRVAILPTVPQEETDAIPPAPTSG